MPGTQTWKKQPGSFGPQIGLDGNEFFFGPAGDRQEIGL
jgi:hypothetical protein